MQHVDQQHDNSDASQTWPLRNVVDVFLSAWRTASGNNHQTRPPHESSAAAEQQAPQQSKTVTSSSALFDSDEWVFLSRATPSSDSQGSTQPLVIP